MRRLAVLLLVLSSFVLPIPVSASPSGFESASGTVIKNVAYGSQPGQVLDVTTGGPNVPAVIFIHGGGWDGGSKGGFASFPAGFADLTGWVAFNIEYRTDSPQPWVDEPIDVQTAVAWVKNHAATYGVDPNRIGLLGFSAGAHLALLNAYRSTVDIKAVAGFSSPTGLPNLMSTQGCPYSACSPLVVEEYASAKAQKFGGHCHLSGCFGSPGGCTGDGCTLRWKDISPIQHVDASDPPTFLAHHSNDVVVPASQTINLRNRLLGYGVPVETVTTAGTGMAHIWSTSDPAFASMVEFFKTWL
ncbi:MAG: alpha/beta hydrolase [Actinomycetota bacterium]